ncbi:TetR/AcrR family transcriptional regulator [Terracoccus luteus]|uniref:AcrR family transcriptional regulator n=1 Tax=Terracoccus luteus TaxID=53356 RepID=A0A839Q3M8_9MICO|nr:TetR/AcrR family transcriptional regulator [Terracoccus luteus]MBB2987241.1 AcrR family transcriptional regulator [Terracoccus luteus]MCP2172892.1 AcrR family transcriptional regulator [Terracoccus luteus]
MGRRPQPQIRAGLLDACTDHALEHGLPDRLEPFVTATGTSARMLLYHFGTRDALLRAVLEQARERQLDLFTDVLRARPGEPYATTLFRAWRTISGADGQPYLRMFGRTPETPVHERWPGFARQATTDWLQPLSDGLATLERPGLATLVLAGIRGLLLDLAATGDRDRVDRAFADLVALIGSPAEPAEPADRAEGSGVDGLAWRRHDVHLADGA